MADSRSGSGISIHGQEDQWQPGTTTQLLQMRMRLHEVTAKLKNIVFRQQNNFEINFRYTHTRLTALFWD